ncbi:MAG: rhodanese-like domain-containing protein [Xanthomonadales bacterium]|nr:rhodanese-like domain-containing protein [Xanthomonadales bacterium]
MTLEQRDFRRLLERSVVRDIAPEECGSWATVVDVRLREEYEAGHLPGAINVPLAEIREAAERLPRDRVYALYCDTGGRSAAAAWLLSERGFDARRLYSHRARERV